MPQQKQRSANYMFKLQQYHYDDITDEKILDEIIVFDTEQEREDFLIDNVLAPCDEYTYFEIL